jgi:2-dehydro-3-deoxygluconokinase
MKKSERIFQKLKQNRLVALLNPKNAEECIDTYEICEELGIILEIAFRSEHAIGGIKAILDKYPDALILAGTVMTRRQAEQAIEAGIAGVVSADYIPDVIDVCVREDVMGIPGGLSDVGKQLVHKAEGYGCSFEDLKKNYPYQWVYKLFPAFSGRIANIDLAKAWRGPFKDLTVFYTGGMTLETLKQATQKDPQGIFCASVLAKHIDVPEKMKAEINRWKEALKPDSALKKENHILEKPIAPIQMPKIVTFGEMMVRLSPPKGVRLQQAKELDVHFGGAEANVAVSLAQFGMHACFISAFPNNDLGDNAVGALKRFGVDTQFIVRKGKRMGIYYLEHGHGPRPSKVIYDRAYTAVSELNPEDVDWERALDGARWFHWTGITPALSDSLLATLRYGLEMAKKKGGITVSADLNFRKKLWSEENARDVMTSLMPYVDVLIGNEEDPTRVFGIQPVGTDFESGKLSIEGYKKLTKELMDRFGFKKVAITLRENISASENFWSACLFDGAKFIQGPRYHVQIVDRVGTGDAFAAGLIFCLLQGKKDREALSFAVAAACLKHSIWGDFNIASVEEVERLAAGDTTGRVQR